MSFSSVSDMSYQVHVVKKQLFIIMSCPRLSSSCKGSRACASRWSPCAKRARLQDSRPGARRAACSATASSTASTLLDLCSRPSRGGDTSASDRDEILQLVTELKQAQAGKVTTDSSLSATWKLLWTTEKVSAPMSQVTATMVHCNTFEDTEVQRRAVKRSECERYASAQDNTASCTANIFNRRVAFGKYFDHAVAKYRLL